MDYRKREKRGDGDFHGNRSKKWNMLDDINKTGLLGDVLSAFSENGINVSQVLSWEFDGQVDRHPVWDALKGRGTDTELIIYKKY